MISIPLSLLALLVPALPVLQDEDGGGAAPDELPAAPRPIDEEPVDGGAISMTLEEARRYALQSNIGLEIEALNTDASRFDARASWGAFDWVVTVTGRYRDGEQPGSSQLSGADVLQFDTQSLEVNLTKPMSTGGELTFDYTRNNTETNNTFQLVNPSTTDTIGVSFNQPLLRGFWNEAATSDQRTADVRLRQQRERQREVTQDLLRDVTDAYWSLVDMREQLAVAQSGLELAREQLEQNQRRLEGGVGTEVEVVQAEADVATRIEALLQAEVGQRDAIDTLKALLFPGTDPVLWDIAIVPSTPLPLPEGVTPDAAPPWTDCLMTALERRSNLIQQRFEIEAAEIAYEKAGTDRLIGLDLQLSANSEGFSGDPGDAFSSAFEYEFPTYTAALVLSTPIRNRTARYAEKSAWANVRRQKLTYDSLEIGVAQEVRAAVRQVVYQAERVRAANESLRLATRQLESEEARFREGLSTNFQVLEFQQEYVMALSNERRARVDYMKALATLETAQGVMGE